MHLFLRLLLIFLRKVARRSRYLGPTLHDRLSMMQSLQSPMLFSSLRKSLPSSEGIQSYQLEGSCSNTWRGFKCILLSFKRSFSWLRPDTMPSVINFLLYLAICHFHYFLEGLILCTDGWQTYHVRYAVSQWTSLSKRNTPPWNISHSSPRTQDIFMALTITSPMPSLRLRLM